MRRPWVLALIFLLAVAAHVVVAVNLREAAPGGMRSDENVYLELASTLWREGTYGAKVSVTRLPDRLVVDDSEAGVRHAAVAWVAGMTDRYAINAAREWLDFDPDALPRGIDSPG